MSYKDSKRGVFIGGAGVFAGLPQAVRVDCADLLSAYEAAAFMLSVEGVNPMKVGDLDMDAVMAEYKKDVTDVVRSLPRVSSISTIGLK